MAVSNPKLFWRILEIRINNSKYAETIKARQSILHLGVPINFLSTLLKMPCDFKGTVYQKIEWDIIYLPRKNSLQILFFSNLEKKFALCVYGVYAEKVFCVHLVTDQQQHQQLLLPDASS